MSPDQQATTALIGTVLEGAYRIERLLGEGGMGAVYAATQLRLDKPVAVKVMTRELAQNAEALERFRREARVTSALGHPHIVQVFDFSTTPGGEPFLVMELLEGEDLEHRIRQAGRLTPSNTLHIVKQVASALMATHGKGIVHRDLKPANIYLVTAAGETDFVKVLDFGISKIGAASTKLTRTAAIVGTPNYMSPEQAEGKNDDVDERTDQWALACIAWECLAGEMLFTGDHAMSILLQIVNKPPQPLLPKAPGLHPRVEDVLLRALARNKNDRFASVNDFALALEGAIAGSASSELPGTARTVHVTNTTLDTDSGKSALHPSTFTRSAGELRGKTDALARRSRTWIWGLSMGVVVAVLLGAFLLLRPTSKPTAAGPAPAAPTTPAPEPAPTPASPVALPAEPPPPEVKPEVQVEHPALVPEPKVKRTKRAVAPEAKSGKPDGTQPQPQSPALQPSKETQDKWRLD